jgi:type VI secretion system protein ImpG
MDARLIRLYEDELAHLRELGREFARVHPRAKHLGLEDMEVADPYVERLLEGFAFMAARVRLKLDAEQPRLVEQLLQALNPNFLAPVPSAMVVQFTVDTNDPNLTRGHTVPRSTPIRSTLRRGADTACEFRTAMAVTLWPLEVTAVRSFTHAPDLGLTQLPAARAARGGLRIRLRSGGGLKLAQLGCERLVFHIAAENEVAFPLHELTLGHGLGTLVVAAGADSAAPREAAWRGADSIRAVGLASDEALLPESDRMFSGHRLLQETAALPQRLLFFEVNGLAARLAALPGEECEIVLLFSRGEPGLEPLVDQRSVALHCTPAINLFPKRLDRVALGTAGADFHVVPDRTRPMDYEVHSVEQVIGHGSSGTDSAREFLPLYRSTHRSLPEGNGYFTLRRARRRPSERQRQQGARVPSYLGDEVYLSLVDGRHGPYRESLRQLSVMALVTNRDLPVLLPREGSGGDQAWQLDAAAPVTRVTCLRGPTRPVARRAEGDVGWQLVAQLTQNHLHPDDDPERAAASLRATLRLYGPADEAWQRQVDGVRGVRLQTITRRLPFAGPLSFGSGVGIDLELDDHAFQGASAYLLATVLERFFAQHAAINSFTQMRLISVQRGLVKAWPPRAGERPAA